MARKRSDRKAADSPNTARRKKTKPGARPKKRGGRIDRETERRKLVARLREILGPEHGRWSEELASVLAATATELKQQRTSLRVDPSARKNLEEAARRLRLFHQFWKKHPPIHRYLPRETPGDAGGVLQTTADLLRRFEDAIARLPKSAQSAGSAELARRWLGFAVVSAFRERRIEISKYQNGLAVLVLETACKLMQLPRIDRKRLGHYISTDTALLRG